MVELNDARILWKLANDNKLSGEMHHADHASYFTFNQCQENLYKN